MTWLLYGANGYTGALVARLAAARGEHPVLAGRSAGKVGALARELGLESRRFGLDDPGAIRRGLDGVTAVAHCAGPFAATAGADGPGVPARRRALSRHHRGDRRVRGVARPRRPRPGGGLRAAARSRVRRRP